MVDEHRVALDRPRDVRADPFGVRVHGPNPLLHRLRIVREIDRVVQALAHLGLPVGAHERGHVTDHRVRDGEHLAIVGVEPARDLSRDLHVRLVVLSHRHQVPPRHQDVRCLEHGVADESEGDRLILHVRGTGHILDAWEARDTRERHQHPKEQVHLIYGVHRRLKIDRRLPRIDPHGEVVQHHLVDVLPKCVDVFLLRARCEHVQVRDQEEALVLVLQPNPVLQRSHVVAQMKLARGSVSCQNTFTVCHVDHPLSFLTKQNPLRVQPAGVRRIDSVSLSRFYAFVVGWEVWTCPGHHQSRRRLALKIPQGKPQE